MELVPGMKLFWAYNDHRRGRNETVTVTKVGRKWADLDNCPRIDVKTLIADGGKYSSPGRCYYSEDEYKNQLAINNAWYNLCKKLEFRSPPKDMTLEKMQQVEELLGLSDEVKP